MRLRVFALLVPHLLFAAVAGAQPYVFVTSPAAGEVGVLDAYRDQLVATFPVSGMPSGAAMGPNGRHLFVARGQAAAVAAIDTYTGQVATIAVGEAPSGLAILPHNRRLYVANTGDDTVSVVNTRTLAVVATIPVGDAPLAVAAGPGRVYVANWGSNSVTVIDGSSAAVIGTVDVGTFPAGLVLHPWEERLYVSNFLDGTISVVDTAALSEVATVTVGRGPRGLALDPAAGRLYVACFDEDRVAVVSTATNTVVLTAASGARNPLDVALLPGPRRLYVAHLQDGDNVAVLDPDTLSAVGSVAAPAGAAAFARGPRWASPRLSFADRASGALSRVVQSLIPRRRPSGAPPPSQLGSVLIEDTEFNPADWTVGGVGEGFVEQVPAGGNPGAWRRMIHFPVSLPTDFVHRLIRPGARYDPSTQGAITAIDVSWDRRILPPSSQDGAARGGLSVGEGFFAEQGNVLYRTTEDVFSSFPWEPTMRTNLTAADFMDGTGGNPDFSPSGGPITFGYYRRSPPNTLVSHGIDNFRVIVHTGTFTAGRLGFETTAAAIVSGDVVTFTVARAGGTDGDVGVTVVIVHPGGGSSTRTLSWASGDGAPKSFSELLVTGPGGARTARMTLINPTGGATLSPFRSALVVFVAPSTWPPEMLSFFLLLQALLSAFSPAWLLAFAVPAAAVKVGPRLRRWRRALLVVAVPALIAPLPACVPTATIELAHSPEMIWNDRIRLDGKPLSENGSECVNSELACLQRSTDPWVGHHENRDQGVVSEIYPELGDDALLRRLPKSDCLWIPKGQSMRASWEAVVSIDPTLAFGRGLTNGLPEMSSGADHRYGTDFYPGGLRWFSACRANTPYDRAWLEISDRQLCEAIGEECPECEPGPYWEAAVGGEGLALSVARNNCEDHPGIFVIGDTFKRVSLFDADVKAAFYKEPRPDRNECNPAAPDPSIDESVTRWFVSCPVANGLVDVCGDKCVFQPEADATLSVHSVYYGRTRMLSPSLMTVAKNVPRRLLRTMEKRSATLVAWHTPPSDLRNDAGPPDPEAPSLRWVENFTPDVRVSQVRVLNVTPAGVERPLAPIRLRIIDPVGPTAVWECPGQDTGDGGKAFKLDSATACRQGDGPLGPLPATPTYLVANVTAANSAPLRAPLTWEADLPSGLPVDEVVVEFTLVNLACQAGTTCNALKAEGGSRNFGRLQAGKPHFAVVEVTNVGPEPLRVGTVRMEAVAGYPDARADFGVEVLSDPQPVPVPLELTPQDTLRQGPDLATSQIVRNSTTPGGTPAIVRPLDADGASIVVGGYELQARGTPKHEGFRITYDDPAADFSWTPPSPGLRRPFTEVAYLRRQPPFYVEPGGSFWVRLRVAPRALGIRKAYLAVGATADSNPGQGVWTRPVMTATGISGPSLVFSPAVLSFPRLRLDASGQPVQAWTLNAIVSNYGNVAMNRTTVRLSGPDAARFRVVSAYPASQVIAPGGDEVFTLDYSPSCAPPAATPPQYGPPQYQAALRVTTDGGDAVFSLRGEFCPQLGN